MNEISVRPAIRYMTRRDMPEVLAIERASFEPPWDAEKFQAVGDRRNVIGMVAEFGDLVVGFMVYEVRPVGYALLKLAVHPGLRRAGVGSALVARLAGKLSPEGRTRIRLVVADTDTWAHLFLRSAGFRATGVARDRFGAGVDGYEFEYRVPVSAPSSAIERRLS